MSTLAIILIAIIGVIFVLSKIPGLEHFAKPLVELLTYFVKVVLENIQDWIIWTVKALWRSHVFLFKNLVNDAEELDPTIKLAE